MNKRSLKFVISAALVALLFAPLSHQSLAADTGQSNHQNNAAIPTKIGMLLPLSGEYAAIGVDNKLGIELALRDSSAGHLIEPVYADSRTQGAVAVSEFRKLVSIEGVSGVFLFRGPVGMAVNPASLELKVPILGGVGNPDFAASNEFAFQLWPRADSEADFLLERFKALGHRKVALLTAEDDWPVAVSNALRERGNPNQVEFVLDQLFPPSEVDFRAVVSRITQLNPDLVFVNLGMGQIAPAIRQLRDAKFKGEIYSNFWAAKPEIVSQGGGELMNGVRYAQMKTDYTFLPANSSAAVLPAYVGVSFLLQALASLNENVPAQTKPVSRARLYKALSQQKSIKIGDTEFQISDRYVKFPLTERIIGSVAP